MQSFMKKLSIEEEVLTTEDLSSLPSYKPIKTRVALFAGLLVLVVGTVIFSVVSFNGMKIASIDAVENISQTMSPIAVTAAKKDIISIPSGVKKENPFVPYRYIDGDSQSVSLMNDIPKFNLIEPPEVASANSEAARIMDTVVSGILYDKFSPSAILNIDGNDYLVKKGDTVNNYKVLAIARDSVTVKLGNNTYSAGIGEPLKEGEVNYNEVSNLSKKFGGEQR